MKRLGMLCVFGFLLSACGQETDIQSGFGGSVGNPLSVEWGSLVSLYLPIQLSPEFFEGFDNLGRERKIPISGDRVQRGDEVQLKPLTFFIGNSRAPSDIVVQFVDKDCLCHSGSTPSVAGCVESDDLLPFSFAGHDVPNFVAATLSSSGGFANYCVAYDLGKGLKGFTLHWNTNFDPNGSLAMPVWSLEVNE